MSIDSLTGRGCQSVDFVFKKRQIKVGFVYLSIGIFSWGSIFLSLSKLLAIFSNLEFGLKFTCTISVVDVGDIYVRYICITMGAYVD